LNPQHLKNLNIIIKTIPAYSYVKEVFLMGKKILSVLIMAMFMAMVGSVSATEGLVSYWNFNEGGGTVALDSAGDNDGTIYGASSTSGICGSALNFDGLNDYVNVPDDVSLEFPGAMSLCSWVNTDVTSGRRFIASKINQGMYYDGGYVLALDDMRGMTGGSFRAGFYKADGIAGGAGYNYGTNRNWDRVLSHKTDWESNRWYHICGVWDGTTNPDNMKLYVDGSLDAQATGNKNLIYYSSLNGPLTIGKHRYVRPWGQFDGAIDEPAIYNRALSSDEIKSLYEFGLSGCGDKDKGHGNDAGGVDEDNPGKGCENKNENGNRKRC
jgi:hypothetical protein